MKTQKWLAAIVALLYLLAPLPAAMPAASAAKAAPEWTLTDQLGGVTKALLRDGDILYLGSGRHVLALDVSDPKALLQVGRSPLLPDFVESLTLQGGVLYACCGAGGLAALAITDAHSLPLLWLADTPGYAEGVAVENGYAFVADGPLGLQVYALAGGAPVFAAEAYPTAYLYDVLVQNGIVYAAGGGSGLFAIDVTQPVAPRELGLTPVSGFLYDVALAGGCLYAACAWGGITPFSLGDPLAPKALPSTETEGWTMALYAAEDSLWAMEGADGAVCYAIQGDTLVAGAAYRDCGFVLAGDAGGDTAFLLDREMGLIALTPDGVSGYRALSVYTPLLDARRVALQGSAAYVSGGKSGLHTLDVSNPAKVTETDWFKAQNGYANRFVIANGKGYLSLHLHAENPLVIFDLADPLHPARLGGVATDDRVFNMAFRSLCLSGDYAYIPAEHAIAAVDIRDPANPHVVGSIPMDNPINGDARGTLLVTTNSYQLQLTDMSDPAAIRQVGSLEKHSTGEAVRFISDSLLLTASDPGVWVVDVSDPAKPRKIAELAVDGTVMDITLDGDIAYLSTLGAGIEAVDIASPKKPRLLGGFTTNGNAYDCAVSGNLLLVADSIGGVSVYTRGEPAAALPATDAAPVALAMYLPGDALLRNAMPDVNDVEVPSAEATRVVVSSAADAGSGTLRAALQNLTDNTVITFDPAVFPPASPVTIVLQTPLPAIERNYVTVDASNAGVILEGGMLDTQQILGESSGLTVRGFHGTVMGLQIYRFPVHGILAEGAYCVIGGSRAVGAGPVGQGNVCSGNRLYGMMVGGYRNTVLGNLCGTDVTGTQAMPNAYGIFVSDWAFYVTVGGTGAGESNVLSGNTSVNIDSWGSHTRVLGNLIGPDITGTVAVNPNTGIGLLSEAGANDNMFGGANAGEGNVISGVQTGVVFSDPDNYQNSLVGNYIGTDIAGMQALPNKTGVLAWTCGTNRIGGAQPGEGNLISGNENPVEFNGYGVTDNLLLGNRIGLDAQGNATLPNRSGINANMGQWHMVLGGYTAAEGNRIAGSGMALRVSGFGMRHLYFAGNSVEGACSIGVLLEGEASDAYIIGNTFASMKEEAIRVDNGLRNVLRGNRFTGKPKAAVMLLKGGNGDAKAPAVKKATATGVSGTAEPGALIEACLVGSDGTLTPVAACRADAQGRFALTGDWLAKGLKLALLATGAQGTSAFSKVVTVK